LHNRIGITTARRGVAIVSLIGEHDLGDYAPLKVAFAKATTRASNVVADLSRCDFIDSTVVSTLLAAQSLLMQNGGRLALALPEEPNPVTRTADLLKLSDLMPTYANLQDALASLPSAARNGRAHATAP
jgi:anti-anti-sigma factor